MNRDTNILVILNPAARSEKAGGLEEKIRSIAKGVTIRTTNLAGDAETLARRGVRQGFKTIVAAGGDGTINEIVNGIGEADVQLGIFPVGTMNVFATELGIPQNDLRKAWQVIKGGFTRQVDLAEANGEFFVQLAGAGLDAEVVRRTTSDSKKTFGPLSYLLSIAQVAGDQPPPIRVEPIDGPVREGRFVLVGNGRFYGGPFVLFKEAKLDDGLLDVLVFQNQSHWDVFRYFQAIAFGSHHELPDVEYFQTKGVRLSSTGYVPVEVDGEVCGELPYTFGFSQSKLRVLVPAPVRK